jgi:putative transcriptional regulator
MFTILILFNFVYTDNHTASNGKGFGNMIDFSPLWATMARQDITQYRLLKDGIVDNKTLDGIKHNRNITLLTLERLCRYLNCTPNDIVRFLED